MAFIDWNDSYSVKIKSIDDQHKKLIGLINEFYEGIRNNYSMDNLMKLVSGLAEYTVYHFSHEEKLMQQYGFSGIEQHKEEHKKFVEKVKSFQDKFANGSLITPVEVTNYIKDWISGHIKKTDMQYSSFFVEKGVQ